jgi:hypothetical protein
MEMDAMDARPSSKFQPFKMLTDRAVGGTRHGKTAPIDSRRTCRWKWLVQIQPLAHVAMIHSPADRESKTIKLRKHLEVCMN